MNRIVNFAESNVSPVPANVVIVPDSVSTDILPDRTKSGQEISSCYIQNIGENPAYIAVGQTCDGAGSTHFVLYPKAQASISEHKCRINAFCVGGTSIAVYQLNRYDLEVPAKNIINS
jgi:hypothetical protein